MSICVATDILVTLHMTAASETSPTTLASVQVFTARSRQRMEAAREGGREIQLSDKR